MTRYTFKPAHLMVVPVLFLGIGIVSTQTSSESQINSQLLNDAINAQVVTDLEMSATSASAGLAETRYTGGTCLRVHDSVEIKAGQEYELIEGQQICDRFGGTARIDKHGKAVQIARTNDKEVIREFLGW